MKWMTITIEIESKVLRCLGLVCLAVHVVDLAEGDRVIVVLHPGEPACDRVVVVPLRRAHLCLSCDATFSCALLTLQRMYL